MSRPARRAPLKRSRRARKHKAAKAAAVPRVPRPPPWQPSPQHLALIGVWSDREVATVAGVADHVVRHARERLGRPIAKPEKRLHHGPRPPTAAERRLVETVYGVRMVIDPSEPALDTSMLSESHRALLDAVSASPGIRVAEVRHLLGMRQGTGARLSHDLRQRGFLKPSVAADHPDYGRLFPTERRQLELAALPPTAPCLPLEHRTTDEARLARELLAGRGMTDFEVARTVGLSRERVRQLRVAMGLDPLPRPPKIAPPPPQPRSYHLSDRSRRAFAALPELFRRGDFIDAYGPNINPTARLMALAANGWLEPVQVDGARWYRRTAKLQAEIDAFDGA